MDNKKKKIIAASVAGGVCAVTLVVVGICAPTTAAFDNLGNFFRDMSTVLTPTGTNNNTGNFTNTKQPLDTPTEFKITEDGEYSFNGVDNADYYILQFYDAADDQSENYLFMSSPIQKNDEGKYSGNCEDLFHYAFLNYTAKLFAYPAISDTKYDVSAAATYAFSHSGAISAPDIAYFYNTNTGTIDLEIENINRNYYYQAYPDTVVVTFTNTEDQTKQQVVTFDEVGPDNYAKSVKLDEKGTYKIEAYATSTNPAVTNSKTETVTVVESLALTNRNKLSSNYYHSSDNYKDEVSSLYGGWGWWPLLCENFVLDANDSFAGRAHGRVGAGQISEIHATALASAPELSEEAAKMTEDAEKELGYTGKTVARYYSTEVKFNANLIASGHLYLYEDGSMLYMGMYTTVGPCKPGYLFGSWVDNGDGTATLNYSPNPNFKA